MARFVGTSVVVTELVVSARAPVEGLTVSSVNRARPLIAADEHEIQSLVQHHTVAVGNAGVEGEAGQQVQVSTALRLGELGQRAVAIQGVDVRRRGRGIYGQDSRFGGAAARTRAVKRVSVRPCGGRVNRFAAAGRFRARPTSAGRARCGIGRRPGERGTGTERNRSGVKGDADRGRCWRVDRKGCRVAARTARASAAQ